MLMKWKSPTVGTLASNREEALRWVNARRAEFFLPPLKDLKPGTQGEPFRCALGESLESKFGFRADGRYRRSGSLDVNKMPEPVATFEADFERGFYPDLVKYGETLHEDRYGPDGVLWKQTAKDSPKAKVA
jgi:hypothetical protein